jgi:transglutaminase-like putative cysteine protease
LELLAAKPTDSFELNEQERKSLLGADRLVPVSGKAQELLLDGVILPEAPGERARVLYDLVDAHMTYDKSKPGYGNGDVLWACDSKTGNCTDFHSMFISLARSQQIPAVFEIGFPLPVQRGAGTIGGYHCWAKFFLDDRGWVPVDISEADKLPEMKEYYFGNLTENRVAFSRGRDIILEPAQKSDPLNYFVYPHVETNGQALEKENLILDIQFRDLDQD